MRPHVSSGVVSLVPSPFAISYSSSCSPSSAAGVTAVGAGAWHVLTGNTCDSWKTCAGNRKQGAFAPDRNFEDIKKNLYHPDRNGHGNIEGDDNHTGKSQPRPPLQELDLLPFEFLTALLRCGIPELKGWGLVGIHAHR